MASDRGELHQGRIENRIKVPSSEFCAQFLLATAVTRIKDRSEHSDAVFGQELLQNEMIVSANTKEESQRFTCVAHDPKWRIDWWIHGIIR